MMVKLVYCICRKPNLTREQFIRYWAEVHAPIGARIPGLRKLVHSYTLTVPEDVRPANFDGMAELWFEDLATLLRARQSPEWQASTADEANFIDPTRCAYFVTEERQVL
jgi:uncharacterized protein (TIGR02118 family)